MESKIQGVGLKGNFDPMPINISPIHGKLSDRKGIPFPVIWPLRPYKIKAVAAPKHHHQGTAVVHSQPRLAR
jgi:hypothetical protein